MLNWRSVIFGCAAGLAASTILYASQTQQSKPASDWPQWRGPSRDGSIATTLPTEWPKALTKKWEIVVGTGHGSPVVSGNRVVVSTREGEQEVVRALDLETGRQLWRAEYPAPYKVNPAAAAHGPGTKATPAIAAGRVFAFGIGGVLSAFDLESGKLLWKAGPPSVLPEYGTASSPLVDGGVVIAHVGGLNKGAVTAFDVIKGTPKWEWTGDGPGYGSPIIATIGGLRHLIIQTQKSVVGLNALNGTTLWQLPFPTDFNQSAITPVVVSDLVVFSGYSKPLTAVRVRKTATNWAAEPVWTNEQLPLFMSSPFVSGNTLFGLSQRNRGQLFALDIATGKTLWTTQGRNGENASVMGNRSWLLVSTTDGELVVAQPDPREFKEVRRYKVTDSVMWAHPAIAGRSIVVKDVDKVIRWTF